MKTDAETQSQVQSESAGKYHLMRIRVSREDSAFVYAILEASEGICSYSTLPHQVGDQHRDLELMIPDGFLTRVRALMEELNQDLMKGAFILSDGLNRS